MSILLKEKISELALDGKVKLLGEKGQYDLRNIKSCSYDLRIGTVFRKGITYSNSEETKDLSFESGEIITMLEGL
jgi:hypothetical protein